MTITKKLEEDKLYSIIKVKPIKGKFGDTFILTDSDFDNYWSNNTINKYIKAKKINTSTKSGELFKIRTYAYQQFETDDGEIVNYLHCEPI